MPSPGIPGAHHNPCRPEWLRAWSTFAEAVTRVGRLNETLIGMVRESGRTYLNNYEKAVKSLLDFEKAAARSSQPSWVSSLVDTHAELLQEVNRSYLQLARRVLK